MKTIFTASITALLLAGSAGDTNAQNWRDKNEGLTPTFRAKNIYGEGTSILVTNESLGFTNHLFHRPDSATSFTATTTTFGGYGAVQSQIVKAKGALFAGSTDGLYRSTDNGVTWSRASAATGYIYSLYAINDTLYGGIGTGLGEAKMSVDTGQTWVSIGYPPFIATEFVKENGVLYVGSNNGLKYTADNGATWITPPFSSGLSGPIITGLAKLAGSVYAACSTGVYKTIDNGANWTLVLPKSMFSLTTIDTSLLGGTNNSGIYQSNQSGTNWNQINTGLPFVGSASYNPVNCIAYNSQFVIASLQGDSAIYVTNLADLGLNPTTPPPPSAIPDAAKAKHNLTVHPNPANDAITLTNITPGSHVLICDVTGKTTFESVATGTVLNIKTDGFPVGLYLIRVASNNEQTTIRKFVVSR